MVSEGKPGKDFERCNFKSKKKKNQRILLMFWKTHTFQVTFFQPNTDAIFLNLSEKLIEVNRSFGQWGLQDLFLRATKIMCLLLKQ